METDFENGGPVLRRGDNIQIGYKNKARRSISHSMTSLEKISFVITSSMEAFFYRLGFFVATHPWKVILSCLTLTVLLGLGLLNLTLEDRPDRLVISGDSETAKNIEFLRTNFPPPIRPSFAVVTADNVLVPEVMQYIIDIHERVKSITVLDGKGFQDICYKLPITKFASKQGRKRRSIENQSSRNNSENNGWANFEDDFEDDFFKEDFNTLSEEEDSGDDYDHLPSVPDATYCAVLNSLDDACYEVSPAELWSFDRDVMQNLTREDIIQGVNHILISPIFGRKVNYMIELGGTIVRNDKGEIISAGALELRWMVGINQTAIQNGEGIPAKTGDIVDKACLAWELEWINLLKNISENSPPGINLYFGNFRSWGDLNEEAFKDDLFFAIAGFGIMCLYVGVMFGRWDKVDQRPVLTLAGLFCVLMALIGSVGFLSLCSLPFGLLNRALPLLLLGIGVDDMFVIMQSWNNLFSTKSSRAGLSIPERMGQTLKHAGVSITVTSLTDITAFAIGGTTIIPGLRLFCIYASVGIAITFLLQITYFVAWFSLDQKRLEDRRNAYCPWIKYDEAEYVKETKVSKSYVERFCENILSKYLFKNFVKVLVLLVTGVMLVINLYGNTLLRQEFNPLWFIPDTSYFSQWALKQEEYYPGTGYPGFVVMHNINYTEKLENVDRFFDEFSKSGSVYDYDGWFEDFKTYSNRVFSTDIPNRPLTPKNFQRFLGKFLYSPYGSKYRPFFKVRGNFSCGDSLPPIETIITQFRFNRFINGPDEHIPGMNKAKDIIRNANLTSGDNTDMFDRKAFLWSPGLVAWETDEIIKGEMYKNVFLSLLCVLAVTLIILANLRVCFFCGLCVIFTIINVGGIMHYWGLTLDMVSCSCIVIAIGLCVDYAAHIGLAFMTASGSKTDRAKEALRTIGPAVFNGGFSTLLAIAFLINSQSHAFLEFFKIFTTVVGFGLFHGLVFLPVILSLIGPDEPCPSSGSLSSGHKVRPLAQTDEDLDAAQEMILIVENDKEIVPIRKESLPSISRGFS